MKKVKKHTSSINYLSMYPDSVALIRDCLGWERRSNFEQEKHARYIQNVATNKKLGNRTYEVDENNAHQYRNSLIQIVKNVHTVSKKKDVEFTKILK